MLVGGFMNIFSPKGFLQIAGLLFFIIALLSVIGVLGFTPDRSIFGTFWWFDFKETAILGFLGLISLFFQFLFPPMWQRYLVAAIGITSVIAGIYNFMGNNVKLFGINLESPTDLVFLLLIGAWALYSVYGNAIGKSKKKSE